MINIDFDDLITKEAIKIWGEAGQLAILQEEAAENITAVSRFNRGRVTKDKIAEEIADFFVSSMSVVKMLDIESEVKTFMEFKLDRLDERIKKIISMCGRDLG